MKESTSCDMCLYYVYVEEYDSYECQNYIDEDDYYRLMESSFRNCPYFQTNDEYKIVRKQM